MNEAFLVFVVGGVMLGGASLLAARPEAFLVFLIPPGLVTALRLASMGDEDHLMMGLLAALFTAATLATTWRFHRMIESSLTLRFDNQDLIESLQRAKAHADALNRELEIRVTDRTARLLEADQRKDEFLATLAHELRNPLAPSGSPSRASRRASRRRAPRVPARRSIVRSDSSCVWSTISSMSPGSRPTRSTCAVSRTTSPG